jgi:putative hydrolases of HD superfamily
MARNQSPKGPSGLFFAAGALKAIRRKGWTKAGVKNQESVADHSYRMALIGAHFAEAMDLDQVKVIRMCLIHDLAESEIGDLTPEEKTSEKVHRQQEDKVIRGIFKTLPKKEREKFTREWMELLQMKTREAKLVWQVDKLEMGLTMKDYVRAGNNEEKLAEFDPSLFLTKELKGILEKY